MACPRCGERLEHHRTEEGASAYFCSGCGGTLCEASELVRLFSTDDAEFAFSLSRPIHARGLCPHCADGSLYGCDLARHPGVPHSVCPRCHVRWLDKGTIPNIRARLAGSSGEPSELDARPSIPSSLDLRGFSYHSRVATLWMLPTAFLIGFVVEATTLRAAVHLMLCMWLHEFGHAAVAWLGGFPAIPLPFFTAQLSDERSLIVLGVTATLATGTAVLGVRHKHKALALVGILGVLLNLYLGWYVNPAQAEKWILFGGFGGELVLATVLISAFYYPLPQRLRWDFFRYPVVVLAAMSLARSLTLWASVLVNPAKMPRGSMIGDDSMGDIERLTRVYKYTPTELSHMYALLAVVCVLVVVAHYVSFGVLRVRRGSRFSETERATSK